MSLRPSEHGRIVVSDPGSDKPLVELATHQCCHCGGHFLMRPRNAVVVPLTQEQAAAKIAGGGTVRGWCQNCAGYVCGPGCAECVPVELMLENMEKGRPFNYRPVLAPVTFGG